MITALTGVFDTNFISNLNRASGSLVLLTNGVASSLPPPLNFDINDDDSS